MYFSSLWFLKSIKQQTSRSKKIYEWLLLLARTILIGAIVTAFAGPVIQNEKSLGNKQIHMIIDNTFSMQNSNSKGNLYDQVKNKALEITSSLESNNTLSIHMLATGESFNNQTITKAQDIIQKSKLQHGNKTINDIVRPLGTNNTDNQIIILSDFQQNIVFPDTIFNDSTLQTSLVMFEGENTNISIDTIWFDKPVHIPNEETEVSVQLKNYNEKPVTDIPVQLFINDKLTSVGSVNIAANATETFKTKIQIAETGFIKIKAEIQDLPVNFDNNYYTGIYLSSQYNILEVADSSSNYLKALFNEKKRFKFRSVKPQQITLSNIQNANTIIINRPAKISSGITSAIYKAVGQGANVIIIPNENLSINSLNEQFAQFNIPKFTAAIKEKTVIKQLNLNHSIYSEAITNVEENTQFPGILKYLKVERNNSLTPLIYNDFDESMLLSGRIGNGNIYVFTFNPFIRNFALDPLFIPTMYNASVITNRNIISQIECTKPGTFNIGKIDDPEYSSILVGKNQNAFIPFYYTKQQHTVISIRSNQLSEPGYYPLNVQDSTINYIAVNHLSKESQLKFHDEKYLQDQIFNQSATLIFSSTDTSDTILSPIQKLWKWFTLLAFLMILIETILIVMRKRVKKHS